MEHALKNFLTKAGRRIVGQKLWFCITLTLLGLSAWYLLYGLGVLLIKEMSLTWMGLGLIPGLMVVALLVSGPVIYVRLRSFRAIARYLEARNPKLQLSLRSCLDFMDERLDQKDTPLTDLYLEQVVEGLSDVETQEKHRFAWGRYALIVALLNLTLWGLFSKQLTEKFYNPSMSFGQTHLDLNEGSITIFEPDYTQIPGRTLPLKPGSFSAFAGAKVRFMIHLPEGVNALYLASEGTDEKPTPLRISEERTVAHELVLLQATSLQFLLAEDDATGRTSPFKFELKVDEVPEVQLRSYTPEGPINTMDPLIIELEVKDDFGVQDLSALVTWDGGEKRLPVKVPPSRRNHFLTKQQWFLSDFEMGDAASFSIVFEAVDNNPISGPGIGRSSVLTYELESPDKKLDEFMKEAKELLDTMTMVLGDNLETTLPTSLQQAQITEAEDMSRSISQGLYRSLTLTNNLISKVRDTPNLTRLDQNFLQSFRNGVSQQARSRTEMTMDYRNLNNRWVNMELKELIKRHGGEEIGVEGLTYDLLLQLKMWAIFEMERQNNELKNDLESLDELLSQAEEMDSQELMEKFNKLMDEVMADFQKMMANAAKEMDMNMTEFMNSEAMQDQKDQMDELRKQIMEALKEGDMDKARSLMEEMKAMMEAASKSMQESVGESSPEMQAMMENMRELMGLLRELKEDEEKLEATTRDLKSNLDEKMGGNDMKLSEAQRKEYRKATEKMHQMLEQLYNKLVEFNPERLSEEVVGQIKEFQKKIDDPKISRQARDQLLQEVANQERLLDFLGRNGLDKLQNVTLQNLSQTETLQEYLDQGELTLSMETGMKLDSSLMNGQRISERSVSRQLNEKAKPAQVFLDTREELQKILQALQQVKQNMEDARVKHMQQTGEQRQQKLAERQADLQRMIQEFMEKTEESFGETQVEDKLGEITRSMQGAEGALRNSRLETGIRYEQDALQKIGEMMEQLQQSSRPNGKPSMMRYGKQSGPQGDPDLEDIFIPESEKKAARDQMKDAIRERLEKNMPDAYGKEIRKYYEKLMDQ